ncbi:hypothetical protein [Mangrovimonas sp. DI 80]|uniref:hypothetical protein n=1 Tax=Mangrovimonas sp. DI 80 TaxID=1779330 RepID=UPI000977FF10|nr:hypothetical protein [Mangrovimonas sp. DI 80]OMP32353.1 hypothetical protein BKM32_04690 [Mangrovimonas sp. DI 80]
MLKLKPTLILALLISLECFSQQTGSNNIPGIAIRTGVGILGTILAIVVSWERNKSILWAIFHGIFGWFYVIYFAITRKLQQSSQKMV